MDNSSNMLQLCRLCLVKDDVNIPIFEEQGDIRQIFLKISSCLPVKVSQDDRLPKKICDGCSYKLDMLYEFWNSSANAEKQLLTWLGEAGMTSQMTDGTISAVAQQIKPADALVKQETIDPPDINHSDDDEDDDKTYMFNKQEEKVSKNNIDEPPPKRQRRTAAVKAAIAMDQNSDDDDDSGEPMTKMEDDSDDSDNDDHEPAFVDVPSTSADDQPGPSGMGKDGVDAPLNDNGTMDKKILNMVQQKSFDSLPLKSKERYEHTYNQFMKWREDNGGNSYSEEFMVSYFHELATKVAPSTLWTQYSMLRSTLSIYNNVDITKYQQLKKFLKRKSVGYTPRLKKSLSAEDVRRFIKEAPDDQYLLTKVILIIGVSGACNNQQLVSIKMEDIQDFGTSMVIKILNTKTKKSKTVAITGSFYQIYKKYVNLRPHGVIVDRLFLNYRQKKCTRQPVGINKIAAVPKQIAKFLQLEKPELYTGHCYRRSSAAMLVDTGRGSAYFKNNHTNINNVDEEDDNSNFEDNSEEFIDTEKVDIVIKQENEEFEEIKADINVNEIKESIATNIVNKYLTESEIKKEIKLEF